MSEDTIARLFAKIDDIYDRMRDWTIRQEGNMAEVKADIKHLEESVTRYQEITMSQEERLESHNIELIKINERIKTALWVMAGVYTISQVLGLWDRIKVLMWG